MAKYKKYDYKQMIMLPISLEDQLTPGSLEFGIHTVVETCMDLSVFNEKYKNDETGRFAYDPKILLKIVLFAYSRGLTGSRKIEQACRFEFHGRTNLSSLKKNLKSSKRA